MIANRKEFLIGLGMMIAFAGVLVGMFMPVFDGKNGLDAMDSLYNSISKASADYIPQLTEDSARYQGKEISLSLTLDDPEQAARIAPLFEKAGAAAEPDGADLKVDGDLGAILGSCLADAAAMFSNQGARVRERYGWSEKQVLYDWWKALQAVEKRLNRQKQFKEAKFVGTVLKRGVECSYNYYGVEAQRISEKAGTVVFSLVFYVVYTVWYGFAFLYLFQGMGFRLEH